MYDTTLQEQIDKCLCESQCINEFFVDSQSNKKQSKEDI